MGGILTVPVRAVHGFRTFRQSIVWWLLWHRQRKWLMANIGLSVLETIFTIITAQITVAIFDKGIGDRSEDLGALVIRFVIFAAADALTVFANLQVSSRIEYQIEYDLRNRLYDHLQRAAPRQLDSVPTGQIVTRSLSDLELLQLLLQLLPLVLSGVPILLGYAIYLSFVNLPLTLLVIALFGFNGYLVNRIRPQLWGLAFLSLHQRAEVTTAIDEPVRGIRVVKSFVGEARERGRVKQAAAKAYEFAMTRARLEAKYDLFLRAAPMLVRAGLLLFGARLVVSGSITLGEFVIFYSFLADGTDIAQWLDELVALWQLSKTGAGRIAQLLGIGTSPGDPVGAPVAGAAPGVDAARPVPETPTGLEVRRATAGYGEADVVRDFDLALPPRSLTVLTGGPGSGKSTVALLCAGMLPPSAGEVALNGAEMGALDREAVHRAVHLVTEEPFLFARTVRENLTVGALAGAVEADVAVDDAALWAALHAAGADDVVRSLPAGLDEPLGDRGMTLSGGQRQRLALARALVAPPRVLVLDDALSAVNPAREVEILRSVRRHAPETAILCITRRPGPRSLADVVVELPAAPPRDELPPPTSVEDMATGRVDAFAALAAEAAYDPRLVSIIAKIQPSGDQPLLPEAAATVDEPPTLGNMLRPQGRRLAVAIGWLLVVTAAGLAPEFLFGEAADYVRERNTAATDRLALGIVVVACVVAVGRYAFRITSNQVTQGVLYGLRRRVFERLSRLGVDYYDRELPGYVSARAVHDIDVVSRFMGGGYEEPGFYELASNTALFIGALGIIAWLSPSVAMVVLPFIVGVLLITGGQIRLADRAYSQARGRLGDVVARLQEDVAGRYVISAFGAERRARLEFGMATAALRRARRWSTTVTNGYLGLLQLALALAAAAVYARAGSLALSGVLTVGTVLALRLYLGNALRPVRRIGRVWQQYVRARVSMRQLGIPFEVPVLPVAAPAPVACPPLRGAIELRDVTFRYPGREQVVLHRVSFAVEPGTALAVVGYTGAGKSSIAKLLARVYDPDTGVVLVDGHDLRELELTSYRGRLGVVPQDAFVFRGSIASNIAYGRPDATREEIEEAARAVGALDTLLRHPGGLSTVVEEEGRNLTAAERQLIALARMWLVQPDVLVLDEATASLDADSEQTVLDAVCGLGRTVILITHRIAVAERSDHVIVIDDGQVIEQGAHAELLASESAYASLWTFTGQVDVAPA